MTKYYRSREVVVTTVNTKTQMVTLGSQAATLADIQVPAGKTIIKHILGVASSSSAATGVGCALLRVEGDALKNGAECFNVGGTGGNSATAIPANNGVFTLLNVNIPVTPTNRVQLFGEMTPTDVGQLTIGATLVFE